VVIIDPAERLNRDAANTLLKTLEEPPGHTVFVLLSAAPESIVETIVSRCRRIDVTTVERAIIEAGLIALGISPEIAEQAASHARGRPGVAVTFARQPDLMGDQARLLERCQEIAASNMRERLRYAGELSERWRKDRANVGRELDAWEMFWEERLYAAASATAQDAARAALEALNAVRQTRDDLIAQVVPRMAFELMLVSFPAATLVAGPQVAREHADV
jgi:DNA polymerase-3 subunit delta'